MNSLSSPMRYLLDKNVVRYAITGLCYRHARPLSPLELSSLSFWRAARLQNVAILISHVSFEILRQLNYREVQFFLNTIDVLTPTRYHARWARRIRETTTLTREDAAMIALASFGSNRQGNILGTHSLLTYDRAMINSFQKHLLILERRLQAMTAQLSAPFYQAALPHLHTPDEVLQEWR
jgi:hypothetical protein